MLILYSTIPGYFSWRNQILGSFLIQSLCKIISDHSCDMDLEEMLKKVNADLQDTVYPPEGSKLFILTAFVTYRK